MPMLLMTTMPVLSGVPIDVRHSAIGHDLSSAALDLAEKPLPARQVHEADVPAVDGALPRAGGLIENELRSSPADLVDAQRLDRLRLDGSTAAACATNAAATTGHDMS
ncbi:hypothetical protein [Micromonospora craterilacus]|uniref:hypothetical protein n=1 Tax=Micromonospora craterilacus TaxID=1655439 RepID=UPI001F1789D2|nr:hypothetical protein [Micromonospora craterilacus]